MSDVTVDQLNAGSDFLPLFHDALRAVGSAAVTFAAITRMAREGQNFATFACLGKLAEMSGQNERTVRRHLLVLAECDLVKSKGRDRLGLNTNRKRRTVTYQVTAKGRHIVQESKYGELPRWALDRLKSFAERAVFAAIYARNRLVATLSETGSLEDRLIPSLRELEDQTGLNRETIVQAKRKILESGLVVEENGGLVLANGGGPLDDEDADDLEEDEGHDESVQRKPMDPCGAPGDAPQPQSEIVHRGGRILSDRGSDSVRYPVGFCHKGGRILSRGGSDSVHRY